MKLRILSKGSCVFKMYFCQWKYDSQGSPAGTSALEIAFLTTSNSKLAWVCVSGRTDSSMVQDRKGMRRSQGNVLRQILLFYVASRGRGNILHGGTRGGKLGLIFSDPLGEGHIISREAPSDAVGTCSVRRLWDGSVWLLVGADWGFAMGAHNCSGQGLINPSWGQPKPQTVGFKQEFGPGRPPEAPSNIVH